MKKVWIVIGMIMVIATPTAALADNGAKPIDVYCNGTEQDNNSAGQENNDTEEGGICDNGARPTKK
ncbi:hypothetical protein EEL32_19575 [Brevibacillus laterosporus]|uniref:Uncharacterized protein n=1 Tax=Brevibacillus laterosporus TaxID=1465 RepID=A0A502IAQ9_BRELA|nr:hypothetical protein [Brevibacillus laterosporus]QDX92845.1 hypothetical protein EEL30_11340 [Brevibacillus laterosporus]RAP28231.1 hypothetical protein C2W64_00443 [Brevibacillus laterosporus]TPG71199.1 hypothetical protein EEL31_24030 [Brevibacillus laterosporus]TPG82448.1 hypothetical protein EEL32_19575 [Brevibacillus laterosporus]